MENLKINGNSFAIVKLLGKGKGGYSYLVEKDGKQYVAKKIHHQSCSFYSFGNKLQSELQDYRILEALRLPLPKMLDVDTQGETILKEYVEGPTVAELIKEGQDVSVFVDLMESLLPALYKSGINIDYYPTNFVVSGQKLFYIDYECNPYEEKWDFAHWGRAYWTGEKALE